MPWEFISDVIEVYANPGTRELPEDRLRAATEAVECGLAGRPLWEMSRHQCLHLAGLAADCLRAHGAVRVWLFGSLARGRQPGPHSDFDLAVEGLSPEAYLGSLGTLLQLLPLPVDLLEMESASALLRNRVLKEGILLRDEDQRF